MSVVAVVKRHCMVWWRQNVTVCNNLSSISPCQTPLMLILNLLATLATTLPYRHQWAYSSNDKRMFYVKLRPVGLNSAISLWPDFERKIDMCLDQYYCANRLLFTFGVVQNFFLHDSLGTVYSYTLQQRTQYKHRTISLIDYPQRILKWNYEVFMKSYNGNLVTVDRLLTSQLYTATPFPHPKNASKAFCCKCHACTWMSIVPLP